MSFQKRNVIYITFIALLFFSQAAYCATKWTYPPTGTDWKSRYGDISTALTFGDIDSNGLQEIIFGTQNGYIFALNQSGKKHRYINVGQSIKADLTLVDFNRDGNPDILAFARQSDYEKPATASTMVIVDGKTFSKVLELNLDGSIVSKPALADFNNDGNIDVLVPARGLLLIDGAALSKNKKNAQSTFAVNGITFASPVVDDFNNDGIYDFLISYSRDNVPLIDVFLSTDTEFNHDQYTFPLKRELRIAPTVVKSTDEQVTSWRLIAPSFDKPIDFYTLAWDGRQLSMKYTGSLTDHDYRFTSQVPVVHISDNKTVLGLNLREISAIWKVDPLAGKLMESIDSENLNVNLQVYMRKNDTPVIVYTDSTGITSVDIESATVKQLATLPQTYPGFDELFLIPSTADDGKSQPVYSPVGFTPQRTIFFDSSIKLELPLAHANVKGYFNQGVVPPQELESIKMEMRSSLDWRNDAGMKRLSSLVTQLYPEDVEFRKNVKLFIDSVKRESTLLSEISRTKDDIRNKAVGYNYVSIMKWILAGDLDRKINKIVKEDPEFLEEEKIADFYNSILTVKEFMEASVPLFIGIVALSLVVLVIFNYPSFLKIYFNVTHKPKYKAMWQKALNQGVSISELADMIMGGVAFSKKNIHMIEARLSTLLPFLIKSKDRAWYEVIRQLESKALPDTQIHKETEKRAFYKMILKYYKDLFHIKMKEESFLKWAMFKFKHMIWADFYEFNSSHPEVEIIKYEMALKFLSIGEYKPAFNYFHKKIIAVRNRESDANLKNFVEQLPEYKIENYFFKYDRHFFSRVRHFHNQIRILTFYKTRKVKRRTGILLDTIMKESLNRYGFPMVVVNEYTVTGEAIDEGLFLTLPAFSSLRRTDVLLRCIPARNLSCDISADARLNTLSDHFARIINIHRNRGWLVQVESKFKEKTLSTMAMEGELDIGEIQKLLLDIVAQIKKLSPLWFIPAIHPGSLHWDGVNIRFTHTGISKLIVDKEYIIRYGRKGILKAVIMTPEFYHSANIKRILADPDITEKTAVYMIGLLAYWLIEKQWPDVSYGIPPLGGNIQVRTFKGAERLINAATAPIEKRLSLKYFEDMLLSLQVPEESSQQ